MSDLTPRDLELIALGAAMGSNCTPCIEHHIPAARSAGLTDLQIRAVIQHADKIRQVPARKTLQTALGLVTSAAENAGDPATAQPCACDKASASAGKGPSETTRPRDMMAGMMSKMMEACGKYSQDDGAANGAEPQPTVHATTHQGCGCG